MTITANAQEQNAATYEALISLIENSQGRLAPIIVACDDWLLRQRIIEQYETEARQAQIQPYRVRLGQEPSVRAALAKLKDEHDYLQQGGEAVFTITGAEVLLRITLKPEDKQSELDKFFGYLQWTREGLREFRYPIVLWVTYRILKDMSRRAPDFWSWRKAVLRFVTETEPAISTVAQPSLPTSSITPQSNDFLPPLNELQAEIQQLEATAPTSPNLATLYDQLGRVYAHRVESGTATNLEQEQTAAIAAFQTAIHHYQQFDRKSAQAAALNRLGSFLQSQSRFIDAITFYQQSLELAREIGDRHGEAASLCNLGIAYDSLGQYQQAINFQQQSLAIEREIGDRHGEASSLGNLGIAYDSLGQYQQAIDFHQQHYAISHEIGDRHGEANSLGNLGNAYQSLGQYQQAIDFHQQHYAISHEIGDRNGEANSLGNLGNAYQSLGQYQQAIDFYQQSLEITREIGDRHGEGASLLNMGNALVQLDQHDEALQSYQQALVIYEALKLNHMVEHCKAAIAEHNQIVLGQL
ncbi:tetratricopeptide repeat protein [Leptolyngbya sp. CCY15150]|uniref:tetratricopeptide repeat protein n=1 Tax=Leptolyngbya sp. CCY15150 TaxID=2767772 RepID=UPI00194E9EB2|nr:tetratricopeptide repeat protein [Leptolyngbya sp. CCY15150]